MSMKKYPNSFGSFKCQHIQRVGFKLFILKKKTIPIIPDIVEGNGSNNVSTVARCHTNSCHQITHTRPLLGHLIQTSLHQVNAVCLTKICLTNVLEMHVITLKVLPSH